MGRVPQLLLRLSVIATAVAVLVLSVRAGHAQDFTPVPTKPAPAAAAGDPAPVYGYYSGQGMVHTDTPEQITGAPPPAAAPQPPYGYYQMAQAPQAAAPAPAYPVAQAPVYQAAQAPYGYNPQNYAPQPPAPQTYAPQPAYAPPAAYVPQQTASAVPPQPGQTQPGQPTYGYRAGDGTPGYNTSQVNADPQAYYQEPLSTGAPRNNADYRLGAGDKLRITVYGEADLSGDYQIDGTGIVRMPLIGGFRANGYTAPALEAMVSRALLGRYLKNPRVNVEIITYRPFYITGAVNKPGEYAYVDHISALNAVAMAGGFTDNAKQSIVYVRHENSTTEQEVPTDQLSELRPGDSIRVKTTLFWDAMTVLSPLAGPAAIAAAVFH